MKSEKIQNKTSLVCKMAIASAVSWEAVKLVCSDHPYLALLSVILCLQPTIDQSIRFFFSSYCGNCDWDHVNVLSCQSLANEWLDVGGVPVRRGEVVTNRCNGFTSGSTHHFKSFFQDIK